MNNKQIDYLNLFDFDQDDRIIAKFRQFLQSENEITLIDPEKTDSGSRYDVYLPDVGGIRFFDSISKEDEDFFKWWIREFKRRKQEKRDALTGLYTRTHWERELVQKFNKKSKLGIALGDIDHFKKFNDQYGHKMGDHVLEGVGKKLRNFFDSGEWIIRYGGEEILMISDKYDSFDQKVQQFKDDLSNDKLFSNQPESVSMSIGLSYFQGKEDTIKDAIDRADVALYQSKSDGRNRLTTYQPYLRQKEEYSIWGFYRYVRELPVRFGLGVRSDFLLYWNEQFQYYDWNKNESKVVNPDYEGWPPKQIDYVNEFYYLLDKDGELWCWNHTEGFSRCSTSDDPFITGIVGKTKNLFVIGLNNQIYEVFQNSLERIVSAPKYWDHLIRTREKIYFVLESYIIEWNKDGCGHYWELPDPCIKIDSTRNSVFLLTPEGKMFRFEDRVQRWQKLKIPSTSGESNFFRDFSANGEQLLLRDDQGKLLLTGKRPKSVPQTMALKS